MKGAKGAVPSYAGRGVSCEGRNSHNGHIAPDTLNVDSKKRLSEDGLLGR